MKFVLVLFVLASALGALANDADGTRGLLSYPDGNTITGRLVATGVFQSDRFGEVRFGPEAHFVPTVSSARDAASASTGVLREKIETLTHSDTRPAAAPPAAPGARTSPQPWWKEWKFSVAGFIDRTIEDNTHKREFHVNLHLQSPIARPDRVSLDTTYDFINKNNRIDKRRATLTGEWERDFRAAPRWFTLFRSYGEYDGGYLKPNEVAIVGRDRLNYVLSQQQGGLGYKILDTTDFHSSVALTWSWFYIDVHHLTRIGSDAPSLVFTNDLKLPWGLELKQNGQIYYRRDDGKPGWQNQIDFTKRINRHLFITLRHEYRHDYPALDANPIDRLRLLFGVSN